MTIYMILGFVMGLVAGVGIGCMLAGWLEKRRDREAKEMYNHIREAFEPPPKKEDAKPWEKN